ncbi:MAG: DUF1772 domain-containing protein [Nocardioidaceae bacterium]
MDQLTLIATVVTAIGSGIVGGMMFAFSVSVMTALGRQPAPQGIATMQAINVVIVNPVFLLLLLGTLVASVVLAVGAVITGEPWLLVGGLLYAVGMVGVTSVVNVPMNNALDKVDPDSAEGAQLWARYLATWTTWNHIRSVACFAAATVLTLTLL